MTDDVVEVIADWPQPASSGEPIVIAGRGPLRICYTTADERVATIVFDVCHQVIYGNPNDEALTGHPLYTHGLKFYSVHKVRHSTRLASLERANSAHPRHDAARYLRDKEHFVFTFQDGTLECLVTTGTRFPAKVLTFDTTDEAMAAMKDAS
ncbi:hypothetical protein ACG04R_26655 [Roseateles sp. BYS78W]|uniref:Uncharacterized protein n=1 Tax=Pelomonas candidula TaxID=3299025 RepID=A0ABW7HK74_9BURK